MTLIGGLDILALLGYCCAFGLTFRIRAVLFDRPSRLFLRLALGVYCLVSVSNVLEHFGITAYFDLYEDYLEIVFIPFFLFFAFSLHSSREVQRRIDSEQEVRRVNEQLERLVAERTAELQASNRELESFCYSVSHDLRAPLRAIDGFSRILGEECAESLDESCRGYLERISRAAVQMGQLIDDLLELSRFSRMELRRERLDISVICRELAEELRRAEPGRRVRFIIADGLQGFADPRLLRQALGNLLGNAWKYTALREEGCIEVNVTVGQGEQAFSVRDNGAGFNMAYADKLFGVFQRLHRAEEFPGSGIGLATVKRIIERHGGRIWAEGAEGEGATFWFTLDGAG